MLRLIAFRIVSLVPLLLVASFLTFGLLELSATDPAVVRLGDNATDEAYDAFRTEIGLDDPFPVRYARWVADAATGDLGESWQAPNRVSELIEQRISVTLSLAAGGLVVALLIGVPLGVAAGVRAGKASDSVITSAAAMGQALPNFAVALVLAAFVAVPYDVFPATQYTGPTESITDWLIAITLPSIALGTSAAAAFARQTRAAYVRVLHEPYIRTALAAGLSRRKILYGTALRNAAVPLVTTVAAQASVLLGGAVIVEQVFALPGLGSLVLEGIQNADMPIVLGFVVMAAVMVAVVQLLLDVSYGLLDPRTRSS